MEKIPFNKPHLTGKELSYIRKAVQLGKISGDGFFTHKCHQFFQETFGFKKTLLTTSCTDALEMAAILSRISPGDEVIVPSFTFPSTATAFVLRGAKIVFADSYPDHPNIDADKIEALITKKTKAIVPVHYAGVACDMDKIMQLASKYNCYVIEDAAQAIDSYHNGVPLGRIGHFGTFSFHETKNISAGEGGLLAINDEQFSLRAEIIREKGTNRSAFFRGEVDKYGWVDIGSSFLPSDIIGAFLFAQLEKLKSIQRKRLKIWNGYYTALKSLKDAGCFLLPKLPPYATNNAHLFFLVCRSLEERQALIEFLKSQGISAIFHYLPLHLSPYYIAKHDGRSLPFSELFSCRLLRLPLFCDLSMGQVQYISDKIIEFYNSKIEGSVYTARDSRIGSDYVGSQNRFSNHERYMVENQSVRLVPLDHNDPDQVSWMYKVRAHPEVAPHFFAPPPSKYLDHVQFLAKSQESGERQFFIVYVAHEMSGYCQIIHHSNKLEVGLALHPSWWGKGIGKASIQALLDYIRQSKTEPKDIILIVKKDNVKAIHLYEKYGFDISDEHLGKLTMKLNADWI